MCEMSCRAPVSASARRRMSAGGAAGGSGACFATAFFAAGFATAFFAAAGLPPPPPKRSCGLRGSGILSPLVRRSAGGSPAFFPAAASAVRGRAARRRGSWAARDAASAARCSICSGE